MRVGALSVVENLTAGRVLVHSVLWNLLGMAAPMLVALFAIPLLIDGLGLERFGLLAIIWVGVGYFSLFDLGVGRALTKLVSERLVQGEIGDLSSLIWSALFLLALLGGFGAILVYTLSQSLVTGLLGVPDGLRDEGIAALRVLAVGLPLVIVTAGLIGVMEAYQRFRTISLIRIPLGILTFAGPLLSLQFTPNIAWATAVLVAARIFALIAYYAATSRVQSELLRPKIPEWEPMRSLLSFGGWFTVTNTIGPLMTYMDRFFISALLSLSAVTYYVTPYEVLSRLQMLPQAIMGVLFPAMAAAHAGNRRNLANLFEISGKVIYWMLFPCVVSAFLLAPEALQWWLGEDFRNIATPLTHWLAAGWMINLLARPAFTVLQSTGRPDLVAKTHLLELLPYLGMLWWFTSVYGISGAAAAWTLRVTADTLILNAIAAYTLPALRRLAVRSCVSVFITGLAFGCFWLLEDLVIRVLCMLAVIITAAVMLWPLGYRLRMSYGHSALNNPDGNSRN